MNRNSTVAVTKASKLLLTQLEKRLFTTTTFTGSAVTEPFKILRGTTLGNARLLNIHAQKYNTHAPLGSDKKDDTETKAVSSYWGVTPPSLTKADGSAWKWNCFRVCDYPSQT